MWKLSTLGVFLAFAASPAQGQQVIFGLNVGERWDSNVFSAPSAQSDFSTRMGPEVRLLEPLGDLTYDFHYVPNYQLYDRFSGLDAWDHLVNSTVTYHLSAATQLQVKDIFEYAPAASNFLQQLVGPTGLPLGTQIVNVVGHYQVLINSASVDLQQKWSELWQTEATLTNFYYDPKLTDGITSNTTSATANLTYAVTPRDYMGGALGATVLQFGSNSVQGATTSYYYNLSAVWNHDFSPTWSLKMSVGPTYVDSGAISTPSATSAFQFPVQLVNGVPALFDFKFCPQSPLLSSGRSFLDLCTGTPTLPAAPVSASIGSVVIPVVTAVNSPTNAMISVAQPIQVQGISQGSQTSLTYFANIQMSKRWETVTGSLGYSRSAGTSGVFSSGTEIDSFSGSLAWTASPVWTTTFSVIWSDQSTSNSNTNNFRQIIQGFPYSATLGNGTTLIAQTPQVIGVLVQQTTSKINVYQLILGLHSDYKLTKRLSIFGNVFFINQTSSSQGGQGLNLSGLDYNATRIDLGFHYEFDAIHL